MTESKAPPVHSVIWKNSVIPFFLKYSPKNCERWYYDVNLDQLLRSKMRLQDAHTTTAPEEVTADEVLKGIFGGQDGAPPHGTDRPLRVDDNSTARKYADL